MGVMIETAETLQRIPILNDDRHEIWVCYDDENVWLEAKSVTRGQQLALKLKVVYLLQGAEEASEDILMIDEFGWPENQVILEITEPVAKIIEKQTPLIKILRCEKVSPG